MQGTPHLPQGAVYRTDGFPFAIARFPPLTGEFACLTTMLPMVAEDLGLHGLPACGVVKPRTARRKGDRVATDRVVLPHRKEPLQLPARHGGLRILQHLRDETHRAAVRYHRKVRDAATLVSALEGIPGVGPKRRTALLRAFGSAEAVALAPAEAIAGVQGIGTKMARVIKAALDSP